MQLKLDQTEEVNFYFFIFKINFIQRMFFFLTIKKLLTFKFNDKSIACNLALLIDGYCMMKNNLEPHIWSDLNHNILTDIDKNINQSPPKNELNNEKQLQQQININLNTNSWLLFRLKFNFFKN